MIEHCIVHIVSTILPVGIINYPIEYVSFKLGARIRSKSTPLLFTYFKLIDLFCILIL